MPLGPGNNKVLTLLACTCLAGASLLAHTARANPEGATVKHGDVTINRDGDKLTIEQGSKRAVINWQKFSIDKGEITQFLQNSKSSAVLNRVVSNLPSNIAGELTANGKIYLVNPNGIVFGEGARVNANSMIASTLNITDSDFLDGGDMHFQGTSRAAIVNLGEIHADQGDVFMIATRIRNEGTISAPQGTAGLGAGTDVYISTQADKGKRIVIEANSLRDELEDAEAIDNEGIIKAARAELATRGESIYDRAINNTGAINATGVEQSPDGTVRLTSADGAVRNDGRLQAQRTGGDGGRIVVSGTNVEMADNAEVNADAAPTPPVKPASGGTIRIGGNKAGNGEIKSADTAQIAKGAEISADAAQNGDGGDIVVWSDKTTDIAGTITARGGTQSGNGGFVETSSKRDLRVRDNATVDTGAPAGEGGQWLLDPHNVILANASDTDASGGGTIDASSNSEKIDISTIEEALDGGNNVTITTGDTGNQPGDITVKDSVDKTDGGDAAFTLRAARHIIFDDSNGGEGAGVRSNDGALDVVLNADRDGNKSGAIDFEGTIESNGGDVVFGGGSDPGLDTDNNGILGDGGTGVDNTPAYGLANNKNDGIRLYQGSLIDAGGGDIIMTGHGASKPDKNGLRGIRGINVDLLTKNQGNIRLKGTGGAGDRDNIGIQFKNAGTKFRVGNGELALNGKGGGNIKANKGVVLNSPKLIATGSGTIDIDGEAGTGGSSPSIILKSDKIQTQGGHIKLSAFEENGNEELQGSSKLLAGNNGEITIKAQNYNLSPDDVNADTITVKPYADDSDIGLVDGDSNGDFKLKSGQLDTLEKGANSKLVIGNKVDGGGIVDIDNWDFGTSNNTAIEVHGGEIDADDMTNSNGNTLTMNAREGNVEITDDTLLLPSGSHFAASNNVIIQPKQDNTKRAINLGPNIGTGELNIRTGPDTFDAGNKVIIGDKDTPRDHKVTIRNADFTGSSGDIGIFGGKIRIGKDNDNSTKGITLGEAPVRIHSRDGSTNHNLFLRQGTSVTHDVTGTGELALLADRSIIIGEADSSDPFVDVTSPSGRLDLTVNADRDGDKVGAVLFERANISTGGGDLIIGGGTNPEDISAYGTDQTLSTTSARNQNGVALFKTNLTTSNGETVISGKGFDDRNDNSHDGIFIEKSTYNGSGDLTIAGTGGEGDSRNNGVWVDEFDVTSSGDVTINGTAGGPDIADPLVSNDGNRNRGVSWLNSNIDINGNANLTVTGRAMTSKKTTTGINFIFNTTQIADGTLNFDGTARGPDKDIRGVSLAGSTMLSQGQGAIDIDGHATGGGAENAILLKPDGSNDPSFIQTNNGDIDLTATGAADEGIRFFNDTDSFNDVTSVDEQPRIESTGSGDIKLQSTGATTDLSFRNTASPNMVIDAGPGGGALTMIGDTMDFKDMYRVAATDAVTLKPSTSSRSIAVRTGGPGDLVLQKNELNTIQSNMGTGELVIGDKTNGTGAVHINNGMDLSSQADNVAIYGGTIEMKQNNTLENDGSILLRAAGLGSASDITLQNNATIKADGSGDAAMLAANSDFINNAGSEAVQTPNGRFLIYSDNPNDIVKGGLGSDSTNLYNRSFDSDPPSSLPASFDGNNFVYDIQPELTIAADDKSRIFGAPNPELTFTPSGIRTGDGDTADDAFSGEPVLQGPPPITRPGERTIRISRGSLQSAQGYSLNLVPGTMTVINTPGRDAEPVDARNVTPTETAAFMQAQDRTLEQRTAQPDARNTLPDISQQLRNVDAKQTSGGNCLVFEANKGCIVKGGQ